LSAYADTSFLVSLYTPDSNSAAAAAQMKRAPLPVLLTSFGELEWTNALELRVFRKGLTAAEVRTARGAFRQDIQSGVFAVKPLPTLALERATQIAGKQTRRLGTRTLDVLHVASALVLAADTLYTFDHRQQKLAHSAGLKVL